MKELFLHSGHLSDDGMRALIDGSLDEMQRLEAAEHLSFCDECLLRYTELLSEDVLEQPEQNVTLPVMRKLRRRELKVVTKRHATAVASVVVTAGLWYTGVFGGAMDALAAKPQDITQPPVQQQAEANGVFSQLMETVNGVMFPEPKRPKENLGPENRPEFIDELSKQKTSGQNQQEENKGSWFKQLFHRS